MKDKLKLIKRILNDFWRDLHRVKCAGCGALVYEDEAVRERTTYGIPVTLCATCHNALFQPFTYPVTGVKPQ